jgi:hypothetical protein
MKCIKNVKTGDVIRVSDKQASITVGREWSYAPKSEWKTPKAEVVNAIQEEAQTISEKQLKRRKSK